jgi:hypothetical protein
MLDRIALDGPLDSRDADQFMREQISRQPRCTASPVSQTVDTRARANSFRAGGSRMTPPSQWSMPAPLWRQ